MATTKKHRRRGPKSTRAGCLLCKPHKHQANVGRARRKAGRRWREDVRAGDGALRGAVD